MPNLTLVVPSQASPSVNFSISLMLMLNLALVESKKEYSVKFWLAHYRAQNNLVKERNVCIS
jgi:hypothetical protein